MSKHEKSKNDIDTLSSKLSTMSLNKTVVQTINGVSYSDTNNFYNMIRQLNKNHSDVSNENGHVQQKSTHNSNIRNV